MDRIIWCYRSLVARYFGFASEKALLIGVTLTATSIAITADTLREMGKLNTEVAKTIIGAAVIDDILALIALAFAQHYNYAVLPIGAEYSGYSK